MVSRDEVVDMIEKLGKGCAGAITLTDFVQVIGAQGKTISLPSQTLQYPFKASLNSIFLCLPYLKPVPIIRTSVAIFTPQASAPRIIGEHFLEQFFFHNKKINENEEYLTKVSYNFSLKKFSIVY